MKRLPLYGALGLLSVLGAAPGFAQQNGAAAPPATAPTTPSTWCRYVPERSDDFAWENDLVAFRAYGPALKKGAEDSGIDCWVKKVHYPIIDKWYAGDKKGISYHEDHGEGYDPYHVGSSRGTGGVAIWKNGKMYLSDVYTQWKIISREQQKSVFELSYDYDVEGAKIHEVKRITIEMGKRLFEAESTFTQDGKPASLDIAVGVTTHDGLADATLNLKKGWIACWEKIDANHLGTGVVMAPGQVTSMEQILSKKEDESHALILTHTNAEGKIKLYAGFAWEGDGDIKTPEGWQDYLTQFAANLPK